MNNIALTLQNGYIDVDVSQTIELSDTNFRFTDGLKEAFSTDFSVPKTANNMHVLGAVGLLDSVTQVLGDELYPAVLSIGDNMMPVKLQVVEVSEDEIQLCLYENSIPDEIRNKSVRKLLFDTPESIYVWNVNTENAYPNDFMVYSYGMKYDDSYAQRHPARQLNGVIDELSSAINFQLPHSNNFHYMIAGKKTVCPQNQIQYIEGTLGEGENTLFLTGGQHITNDMTYDANSELKDIYFNRSADVEMKIYVAWKGKTTMDMDTNFIINHNVNGVNDTRTIQIPNATYFCRVEESTQTFHVENGSRINFSAASADRMDGFHILVKLTITNYLITEDDYDEELTYVARAPRLVVYDWAANRYIECYFDGTRYVYSYRRRNSSISLHGSVNTEFGSLAYFGYYCNLQDFTIADLYYNLQWVDGKKLHFENNSITFVDFNDSKEIDGEIESIRPNSEYLGIKNIQSLKDSETGIEVSTIQNTWLEDERVIYDSIFSYAGDSDVATFKQYSKPKIEDGVYSCDFEELEGVLLVDRFHLSESIVGNYFTPVKLSKAGFEHITQSVEVTIKTFDDVKGYDYVYLHGRKFIVVSTDKDIESGETTITGLLVPTI